MTNSFTKKLLTINITLNSGTFDGSNNTVTLSGLRSTVEVTKGGEPSKNSAKIKIYGMLEKDMNALTTIPSKSATAMVIHKSICQVLAGDETGVMKVAFQGNITGAFASYSSPPNLVFSIDAIEGYYPALAKSNPKGFKGTVSISSIMASLAKEMGYQYENNGVTSTISNPYLNGSAYNQAVAVATSANIEFGVDDGILWISPRGTARQGNAILISAQSGLKEYPIFDKEGLKFECLYNSNLKIGGLVEVQSQIKVARGTWRIHGLKHHLEAETPGGKWLSSVSATWLGS